MTTRSNTFRTARILAMVLTCAAMLIAGAATADDRGKADWVDDIVSAVDPVSGTITVGEQLLRVEDRTRMKDAGGRSIRLHEIEVGQMVSYTLKRGGRGRDGILRRLRVIEGDFE